MDITELIAHLNAEHGYTIPPGPNRSHMWPVMAAQLERDHAAKHAEPIRRGSYADHAAEFPEVP